MSDDLQARFTQAQQDVQPLNPDNLTKLRLYALFKQATLGDATGERPAMFDIVARAKYDAWKGLAGLSATDAMQQYIDTVAGLRG